MEKTHSNESLSLEALKAGDRSEFARMIDLYSPRVYNLALKILGNTSDAEDVLQDTFLKALGAIPKFEGRSSLATWLYRIATNEALMLIRKRKPEVSIEPADDEEDSDGLPTEIVDWCCLPEQELLSSEARGFLQAAVQKLTPALRVVFLLRDVQGLSVRETAEVLNVSEEVVKTRLMRARLKLREDLSKYYGEKLVERSKNE